MDFNKYVSRKGIIASIIALLLIMLIALIFTKNEPFKEFKDYIVQLKQAEANKHLKNTGPTMQLPTPFKKTIAILRSPFASTTSDTPQNVVAHSPLQAFPLAELRFVGTISQENVISAFIMTPDNMMYRVRIGDVIGNRNGKIDGIQPKGLRVMEQTGENGENGVQRIVTLQLKDAN